MEQNIFFTDGALVTRPENPRITDEVRSALVELADKTEFYMIGGNPGSEDLSTLIDSGDAYALKHEARLEQLVQLRMAQLQGHAESSQCLSTLRQAGF